MFSLKKLQDINQLKAGAVLSYMVLGLNSIVGIAYTPYMLRMMGQSEFGLYSLVGSVVAYLTIMDFGIGNAIIRYTSKFRAENKVEEQYSMFGMFLILYTIIGCFAFILGLGLYFNVEIIFGNSLTLEEIRKAEIMIMLMNFNVAFTFPLSIFTSIILAYEKFLFQKGIQILRIILNTVAMILILELGYRAIGMVVVITIFNLSTLMSNLWYSYYKIKIKIHFSNFNYSLLKEIIIYSSFIFLNIIVDRVYWSTGQFVLGAFVGTAAIAVFAVAIQLQQLYMGFSTAISSVFLPKVTAMITTKNSEKSISDLFIRTGRIQFIVISFILSGFILFGKPFIVLWAGPDYIDAYIISLLFFIPLAIPLIQNLGIVILQARNQMKFRSFLYIGIAFFSLSLQIPLAKSFGAIGSAIGISVALIMGQVIVMNIYYHKIQNIDIIKFWKEIFGMATAPVILCLISYYLTSEFMVGTLIDLTLGIILFSLAYTIVLWFFSMNNYEKNMITKPVLSLYNNIQL